jgi:hypothetical protein
LKGELKMIDEYYESITSELVAEYGEGILAKNYDNEYEITLVRADELIKTMGFDSAMEYVKAGGR